jgi:hypothetical protein
VSKVSGADSDPRNAGPLEQTWIERHRKRTGCTGTVFEKRGGLLSVYICKKCGKDITTTNGKS